MSQHSSTINHQTLRRVIGIIAILHPVVLYVGGKLIFNIDLQPSMSHYYWTGMSDVFVGIITATGVFLLCYRGYARHDHIVSLVAGISAILVALFPVPPIIADQLSSTQKYVGLVHGAAAIVFLSSIAYFCLVLFVRHVPDGMPSTEKKKRNLCYKIFGYIIVACIIAVIIYAAVPFINAKLSDIPFVFWLEVIAFWSFGAAWLIKGQALLTDKNG